VLSRHLRPFRKRRIFSARFRVRTVGHATTSGDRREREREREREKRKKERERERERKREKEGEIESELAETYK
jgi:hypothetical protein